MIPDVTPEPRAHERYQNLMQLMRVAEKMTELGWRIDLVALERHRRKAVERVEKFLKMFLAQTKLCATDLGAAGSGATNTVRDWFWIDQGAPHVVFAKLTGKPQFSSECLIVYSQQFPNERFGKAAAALYGLRKNKKLLEFCETYRVLSQRDHRIHFSMNPAGTQTGRWTSSTRLRLTHEDGTRSTVSGNVQQVPSKSPRFDFGEGLEPLVDNLRDIFVPDDGCVLLKCVTPDMRVLTADLRWVPAGELKKGQELIGFDEHIEGNKRRKLKRAIVGSVRRGRRKCVRVTHEQGSFVCSVDHRWLCRAHPHHAQQWMEAQDIEPGMWLTRVSDTWTTETSWEGGWLAGFLDGEGCLAYKQMTLCFTQNKTDTLNYAVKLIKKFGLKTLGLYETKRKSTVEVRFGGKHREAWKALGSIRPQRLLKKFKENYPGKGLSATIAKRVRVLKVEPIGTRDVVGFTTSSKTFLCEGFASHNCDFNALELRLIAYIHGAKRLINWIDKGEDTHVKNAIGIFKELGLPADAKQVKPALTATQKLINDARDAAKPLSYAVSYQMASPRGRNSYPTLYKTLSKIFPTITQEMTDIYASRFFELHPEIRDGQAKIRAQIERDGYTTNSIDGRRLYYPSNPRGQNQALNFHMQSTGAALINRALLRLSPQLDWRRQAVRAQVHDELVLHCPLKDLDKIADMVEACMGEPAQLGETLAGVPAEADPGLNWGNTMSRAKFKEMLRG